MRNYALKKTVNDTNRNYSLKHAARDLANKNNRDYGNKRYSKRLSFSDAGYNLLVENRSGASYKSLDSLSNPIARLGVGTDNIINAHEYINENITQDYVLLTNLYRDNWIVQNVIGAVPNDIVKKWFSVVADRKPSDLDKMETMMRNINLHTSVSKGMKWSRLYGGALGLLMIQGQMDNLDEPLDINTVLPGTFFGIYIIERWQVNPGSEVVLDPNDPDFGLPEYYDINDNTTEITARVHHTKVIRFEGREMPLYEKQRELFWGVSELESIYREIVRRDTTAENIASLVFKANLSVMHIKDLDQIFAINSVQAQERFWNTLQSIATIESSMGIKLVGSEDRAEYLNYGFNGIKDVYEGVMMDLAGATRIPVTKLFGRSPAGMNSTGESDLQNYYDYIDEVREAQFRPILKKLLPILALSCWGENPSELDFEFPEMRTFSDTEKAQLAQQYTSTIIEAFNSNLITQDMAQKELKKLSDKYNIFDSITNELIKQCEGKFMNDLQQTQDPMAGLMGGGGEGGMDLAAMMGGNPQQNEPNPQQNEPNPQPTQQDSVDNEEVDTLEQSLLALKQRIVNNKSDNSNYSLDDIDIGTDVIENKDTLLAEYERLEKINKDLRKDYDTATVELYRYSDTSQIPLNVINAFNNIKNRFINSNNNLQQLKQKIDKAGYHIDLMKLTGDFDKELKDIQSDLAEINEKANLLSYRSYTTDGYDIRIKLIEFIDNLIDINRKIKTFEKELQHQADVAGKQDIDKQLNDINYKINALFEL